MATTQRSLQDVLKRSGGLFFPRGERVRILHDSGHAGRVALGVARATRNIRLACMSSDLVSSLLGLPMSNRLPVPFLPRWSHAQRWNRISAPSLHACARSKQALFLPQLSPARHDLAWPSLGQVDGSIAAGSHDPGSSGEGRKTRRRLDTLSNPDDENARSAVLLRFSCEQCHAGVSVSLKKTLATANMPAADMPVRIHCETGTTSARLVFSTRAECQEFVATYRDDGLLYGVDSPFCNTSATIIASQSKSPEDREIGRRFKPLWEVLAPKLQDIFPNKDAKGNFVVPALEVRAQVLSIYDRRNRVGKPIFSLATFLDTNRNSMSVLLACVLLILLMMCYNNLLVMHAIRLRITRPMCDGRSFASSPVRRLEGRGLFLLCGFPLCWLLHVAFLSWYTSTLHEHVPFCCEVNQTQCSRPYGSATYYIILRPAFGLEHVNPY